MVKQDKIKAKTWEEISQQYFQLTLYHKQTLSLLLAAAQGGLKVAHMAAAEAALIKMGKAAELVDKAHNLAVEHYLQEEIQEMEQGVVMSEQAEELFKVEMLL